MLKEKSLVLGIIFTFLVFPVDFCPEYNAKVNSYEANNESLILSTITENIHIDNNWSAAKTAGICSGEGTPSEPYVIEDLIIDGQINRSCILIENSNVYVRIENCTVFNSEKSIESGIALKNSEKVTIINNDCSNNFHGIYIWESKSISILANTIINCSYAIRFSSSHHNVISENILKKAQYGIYLGGSDFNVVSDNVANENRQRGIDLNRAHNNTIIGNTANNNIEGICLFHADNNLITKNIVYYNEVAAISITSSNYNQIIDNDLRFNPTTFDISGGTGNVFQDNLEGDIRPFLAFLIISGIVAIAIAIPIGIRIIKRKRRYHI
jgi:parallel beta-helix repeat protein